MRLLSHSYPSVGPTRLLSFLSIRRPQEASDSYLPIGPTRIISLSYPSTDPIKLMSHSYPSIGPKRLLIPIHPEAPRGFYNYRLQLPVTPIAFYWGLDH